MSSCYAGPGWGKGVEGGLPVITVALGPASVPPAGQSEVTLLAISQQLSP